MEDLDLASLLKGKLSLADAIKNLEIASTALKRAERIEKKLGYHEALLSEARTAMETFTTCAYVDSKFLELSINMEQLIKSKFEDFTSQYLFQLNEKATISEIESLVAQRVTWVAFNNGLNQISSLKSRFDKHVLSDFEGFKTKVKLELSHKANEKKPEEELNLDEIHQLKNRVTSLETKIQDMFMEEGLDDSEDYDSQEAMDNMMDDEPNMMKDKNSDEGMDEEHEEFREIGKKFQAPLSQFTEAPKSQFSFATGLSQVTSPDIISPRSENAETLKTEVSEDLLNKPHVEASKSPEEVKEISPPEPQKPVITHTEAPVEHSPPKPKSHSSIEIDNEQNTPRHVRGGKASSRADGQTLTRKNSQASSMGGTNMGGGAAGMNSGLRQLNKKVATLLKEIEGFRVELDETKEMMNENKKEFGRVYEKIKETRARCEEVEVKRQAMEMSFIKALRRNGLDKQSMKKHKVVASIDTTALVHLQEQINRKAKKVKAMSTYVEKVAADTLHIKETQNLKINEIIQSLKYLNESRTTTTKQIVLISESLKTIENSLKDNISNVHHEILSLQGPLTDLISDQQRENVILNEDIKKQQLFLNEVLEDYSKIKKSIHLSPEKAKKTVTQPPSLSAKHKFSNNSPNFRRASVITHQNWLEDIPDGTALTLPKIRMSSLSSTEPLLKLT